jgi:hypothetical protein
VFRNRESFFRVVASEVLRARFVAALQFGGKFRLACHQPSDHSEQKGAMRTTSRGLDWQTGLSQGGWR